jgi:hypothetical protein
MHATTNWRSPSGLPMQPIIVDDKGVHRFRANAIVQFLLDNGPHDLNSLLKADYAREEYEQLAQLIGYSVSGISQLPWVSSDAVQAADEASDSLRLKSVEGPAGTAGPRFILRGEAELLDEPAPGEEGHDVPIPMLPAVATMLEAPGFYIAVDTENPDMQVPLAVQDGKIYALKLDKELDPLALKRSIVYSGPHVNHNGQREILLRRLGHLLEKAEKDADTVGQIALDDAIEIIRNAP